MLAYLPAYSEIESDAWIGILGLIAVILIVGCLFGLAQNAWHKLYRHFKQLRPKQN
ncbi:MAG: hypothetical protein HYW38_01780 [Candidatus Colwellbacteria bacterium]|nr:hypothetical protein [Candidatus Colwellbacteria bacterium]